MGEDRAEEFGARNGVPGELLVRVRIDKVLAEKGVADPHRAGSWTERGGRTDPAALSPPSRAAGRCACARRTRRAG